MHSCTIFLPATCFDYSIYNIDHVSLVDFESLYDISYMRFDKQVLSDIPSQTSRATE